MTARRTANLSYMIVAVALTACAGQGGGGGVAVIDAPVCVTHDPTLLGIDVSKWQGDIDWAKVAGDGIEFAFIRVSDGISTIDEKFPANWQHSHDNGIPRGVYQFFRPARDPIAQAQIVIDHMTLYGMGELPPVIDVEDAGGQSAATVASEIGQWIDAIETNLGVRPIIYSGSYFWDDNVGSDAFADYPYWIPHYTTAACPRLASPWSDWDFWQYSASGSVAGIVGDVDMDRYAGTYDQLLALGHSLNPGPEESPEPGPEPVEPVEVVEPPPEPGPEPVETVEVVEPPPEPVEEIADTFEPEPDTFEPEPDTVIDVADAHNDGAHASAPSRSVSRRVITPGDGCQSGSPGAPAGLWALALIAARAASRRLSRARPAFGGLIRARDTSGGRGTRPGRSSPSAGS